MARDDVDWSSRGQGPICEECGNNDQVMRAKLTYRPKLIGIKIPLPYTNTVNGWWCHNTKHSSGNYVGPSEN
jgi:hypothetical protein